LIRNKILVVPTLAVSTLM